MVISDKEDDKGDQPTNDVGCQEGTNPLLIQNILNIISDSLPLSSMFKCRGVCKLWNNILVPKINQNTNHTLVLKIVGSLNRPGDQHTRVKLIELQEILVTMEAGLLEHSTCTSICFNESMEFNPTGFETFLSLNKRNIKVLHYDGTSVLELKKVLEACAQNLEYLSLWRLDQSDSSSGLYEKDEETKLIFPKLGNIILKSYEDGNRYMRMGLSAKHFGFLPAAGICNPSKGFLVDIFRASPKLDSFSCRLYGSSILEALTQTNSYSKLTSLCLKSRVGIPQLRSLVSLSAKMRLKILRLEGLSVAMYSYEYDYRWDKTTGRRIDPDTTDDPELMEFGPLLLEFLKSQAGTLKYLKLNLFTERGEHPDIPTDVMLDHFPHMPNLITFVVGCVDGSRTAFPFDISTFAELFPKLRNLEKIPHGFYYEAYYSYPSFRDDIIDDLVAAEEVSEDFPPNYPVSPTASFSLNNIRNVEISPNLAQIFPFITEFHFDGTIGFLHGIPFCLPRLKHFYHVVNIENYEEDKALKLIRILNGFMTGISLEECERTEVERAPDSFEFLNQVQFARSRPSIFDLQDLETLDFKFSYACESHGTILPALEVLFSWGLSRMTHLKKLRFQFEQKVNVNSGRRLPDSCGMLLNAFGNRNNLEIHSQCRNTESGSGWRKKTFVETKWKFELNLKHHTSEWDQFHFFSEDPDFWEVK